MKTTLSLIFTTGAGMALAALSQAEPLPFNGKYTPCVNYLAVGESRCAPASPPPAPAVRAQPIAFPGAQPDQVQQFLDNHGKPPREFAEFYVNPTPENAQRWVAAFRAQQAKANAIAAAWREAEQPPATPLVSQNPANQPILNSPAPTPTAASTASAARPAAPTGALRPGLRLGAYATPVSSLPQVVYYFSASCPFCARLKPDLAAFTRQHQSKLTFTCVDLTPLSPRQTPNPANRDGLPCDWRLPNPNEVERLQIRQTPTLLVQRPDGTGQRLSGLVSPAQLQAAVFGQ
jgi:hypothetical protein